MPKLASVILSLIVAQTPQVPSTVGDPAPPTATAFLTEGLNSLGYDTFDPEGQLAFRVIFTPVQSETYGRPSSETVWEARRVRFLPKADRAIDMTTSLECAGFMHILERIAELNLGRFTVAGVTELPVTLGPQTRDSYTYRFHGSGLGPEDANTRLSVEGSAGQVGELGQAADFQLKDCWRTNRDG